MFKENIRSTNENFTQVYTISTSFHVEKMVFVKNKGWLSFSCEGRVRLWAVSEIEAIECIDPPTTAAPTTTTQPPGSSFRMLSNHVDCRRILLGDKKK